MCHAMVEEIGESGSGRRRGHGSNIPELTAFRSSKSNIARIASTYVERSDDRMLQVAV